MAPNDSIIIFKKLCACIIDEMKENPDFRDKVGGIITPTVTDVPAKPSHKRAPAKIDPIKLIINGEENANEQLAALSIEELKDIIAQHGMDNAKLAMKWKNKERLINFIIETAQRRSKKGDAFRESN